jgi:hypothetical protein
VNIIQQLQLELPVCQKNPIAGNVINLRVRKQIVKIYGLFSCEDAKRGRIIKEKGWRD